VQAGLDGDPLTDARNRDFAIRDYKTHMKTVLRRASNTVNPHLTALDHFFTQLGLGRGGGPGVRIAELGDLDDDVPLSARKGKVIVRSGKGETSREIPLLDGTARTSITEWRTDRASWPGVDTPALVLNRRGGRLSARADVHGHSFRQARGSDRRPCWCCRLS
jgi:hypothetical protein